MTEQIEQFEIEDITWEELVRRREWQWAPHRKLGQKVRFYREARRHTYPVVRVIHPDHGEVVVHAESNSDAVHQAAKAWGVAFTEISRTARVWRLEEP